MNREFDAKRQDMNSLLHTSVPDEIDFSLTSDDPMKDVDNILTKKLAERNYDIASVASDNNNKRDDAKKWLGIDNTVSQSDPQNEVVGPPVKSYTTTDIFDKLKPSGGAHGAFMSEQMDDLDPKTDVHHLLTMILANQKKIMTHLKL
jgi:hypothetical protein